MPFYDLECSKCKYIFNIKSKISERNNIKCPKCNSSELNAVYTNVNIVTSKKDSKNIDCPNIHKCNGCCH